MPTLYQYFGNYGAALVYHQIRVCLTPKSYNWWNQIVLPDENIEIGLYLGALPVYTPNQNTLHDIRREGIKAVLSMIEPF